MFTEDVTTSFGYSECIGDAKRGSLKRTSEELIQTEVLPSADINDGNGFSPEGGIRRTCSVNRNELLREYKIGCDLSILRCAEKGIGDENPNGANLHRFHNCPDGLHLTELPEIVTEQLLDNLIAKYRESFNLILPFCF